MTILMCQLVLLEAHSDPVPVSEFFERLSTEISEIPEETRHLAYVSLDSNGELTLTRSRVVPDETDEALERLLLAELLKKYPGAIQPSAPATRVSSPVTVEGFLVKNVYGEYYRPAGFGVTRDPLLAYVHATDNSAVHQAGAWRGATVVTIRDGVETTVWPKTASV